MKKRNVVYSVVAVSVLVITQFIIRSIGVENISVQATIGFFSILCSFLIFATYKDGKKGFGIRYNIIITVLTVIASISICGMAIAIKVYPGTGDVYGKFLLILALISFFTLGIFVIIYRIIYEAKRK